MSGELWICRACDLSSLSAEIWPDRILSIAEPGFHNATPVGIISDRHHHLHFDDIVEADRLIFVFCPIVCDLGAVIERSDREFWQFDGDRSSDV